MRKLYCLIIMGIVLIGLTEKADAPASLVKTTEDYIRYVAHLVKIDPKLLLSICWKESRLRDVDNHDDGRGGTSHGICQIKGGTYRSIVKMYKLPVGINKKAISNRYNNLLVAAHLLKHHQDQCVKSKARNLTQCTAHYYNTGRRPAGVANQYARHVERLMERGIE